MTATIENTVTINIPIVHRELLLRRTSRVVDNNPGYIKIFPPLFYEDPNISTAHIFTESDKTDISVEMFEGTSENLLYKSEQPSVALFRDHFLGMERTTTITHIF